MEKKIIFGVVLGRLAILKKKLGDDYEQLLTAVFSCFHGQKSLFFRYPRDRTKKLHKIKVRKPLKNL